MNQIFFGWVDLEEFSNVEREELFYHKGKYYWYKLTLEPDQFCIYDTCGRMVPFGNDVMGELSSVLTIINLNRMGQEELDHEMEVNIQDFYSDHGNQ